MKWGCGKRLFALAWSNKKTTFNFHISFARGPTADSSAKQCKGRNKACRVGNNFRLHWNKIACASDHLEDDVRKFVINAFLKSLAGLLRKKVLSKNFKFCIFELRMILYLYKEDARKNCISLTLYQQIIFRQFHNHVFT